MCARRMGPAVASVLVVALLAFESPAEAGGELCRATGFSNMLSMIPDEDIVPDPVVIPAREDESYIRPPVADQTFVKQLY